MPALPLAAWLAAGNAWADGHYTPGVEGLQGASVPGPGAYYLGYLVNYRASTACVRRAAAPHSRRNTGTVTALANRVVWMHGRQAAGRRLRHGSHRAGDAHVAHVHTPRASPDSRSGVGDVYLGPLVLGWHGPQWDAVAAAGLWLDNASDSHPASPGKGFKSTMLTGGLTYYFDGAKTISGSALARYEFNSKKDGGFRPGQQLTLEWGLGKSFGAFSAGAVGYSQWQTSNDKGPGASDERARRHALGAEVVIPVPGAGMLPERRGLQGVQRPRRQPAADQGHAGALRAW